ncbi:hypothetical protein HOY82DRAFT_609792 [Tuber indicum]|nr:hypothetical protein HOY82DRAFT_609792 [Tuber indicum]
MYQYAPASVEKAPGADNPVALDTMNMVGKTLLVPERQKREPLGPYDVDTILSLHGPAVALPGQKKYGEEVITYRRALGTLGPNPPFSLESVNMLGETLLDLKKYEEAEIMCRRALAGRERILGPLHRDTSTLLSVNNLGVMYRRDFVGAQEILGLDDQDTPLCVYNL